MQVFRDRAATVTVRNVSYVRELVFSGPMTPEVFARLYARAAQGLDGGVVLCDSRTMVPLGHGADFVCPSALDRDCAVVVSRANRENADAYSVAASKRGVLKAIFYDYDQARAWVARRRLSAMQYPQHQSPVDASAWGSC